MRFVKGCEKLQKMDCFNEVIQRIEMGHSASRLADFIQQERHEYTDVTKESLERVIRKFIRKSGTRYIASQVNNAHVNLRNSLPEIIDPAEMYQVLIAIQTDRVMLEHKREQETGKISEQGNKQIALMDKILKNLSDVEADRKKIKAVNNAVHSREYLMDSMDMVKQQYVEKWGSQTAQIMLNPESRRRVLNALEQVRAGADGPLAQLLSKHNQQLKDESDRIESIEAEVVENE